MTKKLENTNPAFLAYLTSIDLADSENTEVCIYKAEEANLDRTTLIGNSNQKISLCMWNEEPKSNY